MRIRTSNAERKQAAPSQGEQRLVGRERSRCHYQQGWREPWRALRSVALVILGCREGTRFIPFRLQLNLEEHADSIASRQQVDRPNSRRVTLQP